MSENTKVSIVSLGCAKNRVDAEMMLYKLKEAGFTLKDDPADADAVIINTCGFIESAKKEAIDTTTPSGKFMLTIFGAVAELERDYILQRQREGIEVAKAKGVYTGRKPVVHADFDTVVRKWRAGQITAVEAMKRLDMKSSTFYRKVKGAKK